MVPFLCLLLSFLVGLARAQEPATVAVLPMEKAAASAQYDGLGRALAGMLVSDLSTLPGLTLVERERLDALLAEMKLGESGFLDPKTAQKLGKGVGARFVVAGSFTVLEPKFLLDARIVEVQTGEVVKAAATDGTVADFVAVEKALVEELVTGLNLQLSSAERRRLMVQAPTEKFTALAAYGKGLAREREGKLDQAKAAFEQALSEDPAFAEAQAALGALSDTLAKAKAEREGTANAVKDVRYSAVLADSFDMRTRSGSIDPPSLALWLLRLGVLEAVGRDCDRYAEMKAWSERVGWKIVEPQVKDAAFAYLVMVEAQKRGLDRPIGTITAETPEHQRAPIMNQVAGLLRFPVTWIFDEHSAYRRGHGLVDSLLACYADPRALTELDGLRAALQKAGVGNQPISPVDPRTLDDLLQITWVETRAERFGADAELNRRVQALIERGKAAPAVEPYITPALEGVQRLATRWEEHRRTTRGLADAEIERRMRILAEGKAAATPVCTAAVNLSQAQIVSWLAQLPAAKARGDERHYEQPLLWWAPASDLGCIDGVPPTVKTAEDAWARLDGARKRAKDTTSGICAGNWAAFDMMLTATKAERAAPVLGPTRLAQMWQAQLGLVANGCATE